MSDDFATIFTLEGVMVVMEKGLKTMNFEKMLEKLNPRLPKVWLLVLAGLMWTGVGVMLLTYSITWLTNPISAITIVLGLLGVIISIAANRFQFSNLARRNIERILSLNDKACLFAFQAWKGYLIICVFSGRPIKAP